MSQYLFNMVNIQEFKCVSLSAYLLYKYNVFQLFGQTPIIRKVFIGDTIDKVCQINRIKGKHFSYNESVRQFEFKLLINFKILSVSINQSYIIRLRVFHTNERQCCYDTATMTLVHVCCTYS